MRHVISALQRFTTKVLNSSNFSCSLSNSDMPAAKAALSPRNIRPGGIPADTLVATPAGWQPVGTLFKGDEVITFDHGRQRIVSHETIRIKHDSIPDRKAHTVAIPPGIFGNHKEIHVMPDQEILIESDQAEDMFGDPFVLIPAALLEGFNAIYKAPIKTDLTLSVLTFEREEILYCNGGLLCLGGADAAMPAQPAAQYPRLSTAQLKSLIAMKQKRAQLRPAFAGQSVDETYAAIAARLA